jgi:hypothetical protein
MIALKTLHVLEKHFTAAAGAGEIPHLKNP